MSRYDDRIPEVTKAELDARENKRLAELIAILGPPDSRALKRVTTGVETDPQIIARQEERRKRQWEYMKRWRERNRSTRKKRRGWYICTTTGKSYPSITAIRAANSNLTYDQVLLLMRSGRPVNGLTYRCATPEEEAALGPLIRPLPGR